MRLLSFMHHRGPKLYMYTGCRGAVAPAPRTPTQESLILIYCDSIFCEGAPVGLPPRVPVYQVGVQFGVPENCAYLVLVFQQLGKTKLQSTSR